MSYPLACLARYAVAVLLATSAIAQAQVAPALPSIASFFDNPQFDRAALSPDGKLLAVMTSAKGKRDGLTVIDLATMQFHSTARFNNADVGHFQWVNKQRLLFDTFDKTVAQGDIQYGPGLYAANFDGSGMKQLADRRGSGGWRQKPTSSRDKLLPWNTFMMPEPGAQDSDSVYVTSPSYGGSNGRHDTNLLLLDTLTGRAKRVERPDNTTGWLLDHQGQPRLTMSINEDKHTVYYREPGSDGWRELLTSSLYLDGKAGYRPLAFGPDGALYVEARNGKDKDAVYAFDIGSGKLREPALVTTADYDFTGKLIMSGDKLLGFRVTTDAESTIWFDPAMKALQEEVDQRLDNTVNMLSVPVRAETPWVLVESYSDVRPRSILLYNKATKAFTKIGDTHPEIRPEQMGRQEMVRYKARDGLEIPALLTLPAGGKRDNLPLVVLVHGGPYMRGGSWGWQADAQFLASRGYAVLEPEYRGSTGFGYRHFRAGWKQWGLAMQNDVADGAKWAIAKGIVDPKRICIAGASYGGYATLMGLVNDPDLYKCGINWVGVTDIGLMFTGHWRYESDLSARYIKYGMPELVGDPVKDAAQLTATSPLAQAARIRQPLLLAYGGADKRVPLYHGNKFYDAVKQGNKNVEWVVYPEEGHGWALQETRIDFWSRVEKFLEKNIGK
ncbi:MAG: alpha/beta fold hydrolase [Pseudomonadota bacterium]